MLKKFLMLGVMLLMVMGNMPSIGFGNGLDNTETKSSQQQENLHLTIADAFDLLPLIGKDIKTLNIPEEAIKYIGAHPFCVYYDTTFRGQPAPNVLMAISYDFNSKADYVNSISITCKDNALMDCQAYLEAKLGQCHSCGTLPYAASNGGAQTYFTYYKDGLKYHLSAGSDNNYYTLVISKGEPKGAPKRDSIAFGLNNPPKAEGMMTGDMSIFQKAMASGNAPTPKNSTATSSELWTCGSCGYTSNKGRFCTECGTPKK